MAGQRPFIGRTQELAGLQGSLAEMAAPRGIVVFVRGELGIGKTRLMEEFARRIRRRRLTLLHGRWYESREMPAYIGFREALAPALDRLGPKPALDRASPYVRELALLGPEFAAALGAEARAANRPSTSEQYRLWKGVSMLLRATASEQGVVLILDDLQWADRTSLGLLGFLGREIAAMPVVLIGAYREEDVAQDHPLHATISELAHSRALRALRLTGLSREEVGSLAVGVSGTDIASEFVAALHDETQGNPLFVEELMRDLIDKQVRSDPKRSTGIAMLASELEAPEGLRAVMGRRLARLSDDCQHILSVAAAVGREFDLALLEAVSELPRDALLSALDEAIQASVLREAGPSLFAFAHPLMRNVVYQGTAPSERLRRHAQIAESLERLYGPNADAHAREIAAHLVAAGDLSDASTVVTYALKGARQARVLFAFEEGRALLASALRSIEHVAASQPRVRVQLLMELGYAETSLGHPDEAIRLYREALVICESDLGDEDATDVRRWLAGALIQYGRWSDALAVTRAGLATATESRTYPYHGLVGSHAMALMLNGSVPEAEPWVNKLLELAFDGETTGVANHAAGGWHSWCAGDRMHTGECFRVARKLFLEGGFDATAAAVACDHAVTAHFLAAFQESDDAERESEQLATSTARTSTLADLRAFRSLKHVQRGEWGDAERKRNEWRALASNVGGATIYSQLAGRGEALELLWKRGPDAARDALDPSFPLNQPLIAALRAEAGDREGAKQLLDLIGSVVPAQGRGLFWLAASLPLVSAFTTLGDTAASHWRDALSEYSGCLFDWFMVDIELGRISASMSCWDDAEQHFTHAIDLCRQRGFRPLGAQVQYHLALTLLGRRAPGDRRRAIALLEEADALLEELELDYLRQKVQVVLARPRRGRPPSANRAGLTERELAVVSLLSEGRSNREIGERLFITESTVEHHLASIYGKLAVPGRSGVIAYALREGIA